MARLPPPCHSLYCRLRLFDRRTRRHPPLWTTFLLAALGICHSRRLPTQRRRRSDPNDTSPTRSQQSEGASSSRSPRPCRDVLAAIGRSGRRREFLITDAVRLAARRECRQDQTLPVLRLGSTGSPQICWRSAADLNRELSETSTVSEDRWPASERYCSLSGGCAYGESTHCCRACVSQIPGRGASLLPWSSRC